MSSKPITVQLTLSKTGFSQGITSAQRQMRQFAASAQEMGHSTVSSMQASSAAIRVLEGGMTGNIRAAERFIGILPGVGAALRAAFPLVGGIALAGVFVKIGEEAVNFVQKMNEIPPNPFEGVISSAKLTNDQLEISNDRLAMEIAKLEHKPANGMALALDQARESSDKLFESLMKANSAFTEAMGKSNIGTFKGLWNNLAPTDAANKDISRARSGVQSVIADHQPAINDALASGDQKNVDQAREALMVDLQKAYAQQDNALRAGLAAAQTKQASFKGAYSEGSDQSKVIEKYQAALDQSTNEQREAGGNYGQSIMQPQKDALDAAKSNQETADQAQRALVEQWHKNLDEQKADYDMTIAQEAQFWVQRMEASKKGSISYLAALDETNKDISRMRAENVRAQGELDKTTVSSYSVAGMDLSKGDSGAEKEGGRDASAYLKNLNEGITLQRANANAIAEAALQMAVMTGQMSKLDAAQAQAILHAQEYKQATDALALALANASSLPAGLERQAAIAGLTNQGAQMAGQRAIQSAQDQQGIASQQIGPGITQALGRMANDWTNMTSEIVQIMTRAADSFNSDIVKAMTGQGKKGDFGKTFMDAGQGLLKTGLQGAEGSILKALHLGGGAKPDGSAKNPFYVVMTSGGSTSGVAAGGALGGAAAPLLGGLMGKLGPFIQPFIPHFAAGGDVLANRPAMVGENGPELFLPSSSGRIVPNSKLGGGGDNHFHFNIQGNSDPAAVHASIMRAAPHIVGAAMQAQRSSAKRSPSGR